MIKIIKVNDKYHIVLIGVNDKKWGKKIDELSTITIDLIAQEAQKYLKLTNRELQQIKIELITKIIAKDWD